MYWTIDVDASIPILVKTVKSSDGLHYSCCPLFIALPAKSDLLLSRAMTKLAGKVKQHLDRLGRRQRMDQLVRDCFSPALQTHQFKFTYQARSQRYPCKFVFVEFSQWGQRVVFCPTLQESWMLVPDDENLYEYVDRWLQKHLRQVGKVSSVEEHLQRHAIQNKAWVAQLDVRVQIKPESLQEQEEKFATLWDETKVDGAVELQRVGHCLDELYPDDLSRAMLRDREVGELTRLLQLADRRPVVILGGNKVGKTTLLHECVYQRVSQRKGHSATRNFWMLAPQRLISGMSYVGEWENRLLAILQEASKRDHVLCFQDFLGLYHAGVSSGSDLSVAAVLKTHVAKRSIRVLTEMTPEQWGSFRERDRGLADQFHVMRMQEPSSLDTLRIVMSVQRSLEARWKRRFDPEVLPTVMELQRRYVRDAAFPGKAANFLKRLAVKSEETNISRELVLNEFHTQTGVSLQLLDERKKLPREEIDRAMSARLIGQPAALRAATDVVSIAKARINSPDRPLAVMLLLGPTGVGKTQCAKVLADYLFGSEERLLRFDMNEFSSAYAIASLIGQPHHPDGLLTTPVRHQPFSVVLFDEVEKAHPDFFDLLLQVTGEGRLTDMLGRVADFTNCIVILTSNLGAQDAQRRSGFAAQEGTKHVYRRAAEQFFRPEFFNRIDHVIPFASLSRQHIRDIANLLIQQVFRRDGLARRQSVLVVDDQAMERVVDAGYHPQLGARALKRSIEQRLTAPVAGRLAAIAPDSPTVISLFAGKSGISPRVDELTPVELQPVRVAPAPEKQKAVITAVREAVARIRAEVERDRPSGSITVGELTPEQCLFYQIQEQASSVEAATEELQEAWRRAKLIRKPRTAAAETARNRIPAGMRERGSARRTLLEMTAARDIQEYLHEASQFQRLHKDQQPWEHLRNEAALLHALVDSRERPERVLFLLRVADASFLPLARVMQKQYLIVCEALGLDVAEPTEIDSLSGNDAACLLAISGPLAWWFADHEQGTQLFHGEQGELAALQTLIVPLTENERIPDALRRIGDERRQWLEALRNDTDSVTTDPWRWQRLLRIFDKDWRALDFRSELAFQFDGKEGPSFRDVILSGLQLPDELESVCTA